MKLKLHISVVVECSGSSKFDPLPENEAKNVRERQELRLEKEADPDKLSSEVVASAYDSIAETNKLFEPKFTEVVDDDDNELKPLESVENVVEKAEEKPVDPDTADQLHPFSTNTFPPNILKCIFASFIFFYITIPFPSSF